MIARSDPRLGFRYAAIIRMRRFRFDLPSLIPTRPGAGRVDPSPLTNFRIVAP